MACEPQGADHGKVAGQAVIGKAEERQSQTDGTDP